MKCCQEKSADNLLTKCCQFADNNAVIPQTICCRLATKKREVSSNRCWRPILRASIWRQTIHPCIPSTACCSSVLNDDELTAILATTAGTDAGILADAQAFLGHAAATTTDRYIRRRVGVVVRPVGRKL
jgi:hypothetical protein